MATQNRKVHYFSLATASILLAANSLCGATIIGAIEDAPGVSTIENNGDYNDQIFQLTGNVTLGGGGVFSNLTSGSVTEGGGVFWDQRSQDGSKMNVGYCLLGTGSCSIVGTPYSGLQYYSTLSGGAVNGVSFTGTGSVTVTLLGEISGYSGQHTLGWYDLATNINSPGALHQIFSGSSTPGASYTFTLSGSGNYALYSQNYIGNFYSSVSTDNLNESTTQQHFAFFTAGGSTPPPPPPPPPPSAVPEPGYAILSAGVLFAIGLNQFRHRRRCSA